MGRRKTRALPWWPMRAVRPHRWTKALGRMESCQGQPSPTGCASIGCSSYGWVVPFMRRPIPGVAGRVVLQHPVDLWDVNATCHNVRADEYAAGKQHRQSAHFPNEYTGRLEGHWGRHWHQGHSARTETKGTEEELGSSNFYKYLMKMHGCPLQKCKIRVLPTGIKSRASHPFTQQNILTSSTLETLRRSCCACASSCHGCSGPERSWPAAPGPCRSTPRRHRCYGDRKHVINGSVPGSAPGRWAGGHLPEEHQLLLMLVLPEEGHHGVELLLSPAHLRQRAGNVMQRHNIGGREASLKPTN